MKSWESLSRYAKKKCYYLLFTQPPPPPFFLLLLRAPCSHSRANINYSGFRCPARLHQNINFFLQELGYFKSIGNTNTRFDILVICVMSSTQGFQKKTLYSPAMYPIVYSATIHTNTFIKFKQEQQQTLDFTIRKKVKVFIWCNRFGHLMRF